MVDILYNSKAYGGMQQYMWTFTTNLHEHIMKSENRFFNGFAKHDSSTTICQFGFDYPENQLNPIMILESKLSCQL